MELPRALSGLGCPNISLKMSHSFYYKNPALKKFLTISPKNIFFYFAKWNFLIFSQKKAFLIFQEAETLKSFLYLGNGTFRAQKKNNNNNNNKKKKIHPQKISSGNLSENRTLKLHG